MALLPGFPNCNTRWPTHWLFALACCWLSLSLLVGCGKKDVVTAQSSGLEAVDEEEPEGSSEDTTSQPGKTTEQAPDAGDSTNSTQSPTGEGSTETGTEETSTEPAPDPLPKNAATKLMEFIAETQQKINEKEKSFEGTALPADLQQDLLAERDKATTAILDAAKMILADEQSTPEQREKSVEAAIESLVLLNEGGKTGSLDRLVEFATPLKEDKNPFVRRQAKWVMLTSAINRLVADQTKDGQEVLQALTIILNDDSREPSPGLFNLAHTAITTLLRTDNFDEGVEAMRLTVKVYSESENPDAKAAGEAMKKQLGMVEMQGHTLAAVDGDKEAAGRVLKMATEAMQSEDVNPQMLSDIIHFASDLQGSGYQSESQELLTKLSETADKMIAIDPPDLSVLARMIEVSTNAEYSGNLELAKQINSKLVAALPRAKNPEFDAYIRKMIEPTNTRLGLIGQPIEIEGESLDGSVISWAKYEGKVVLVDFWATWCLPCLEEIPNIKNAYDRYHEHGFEVVGVSLDDEREGVNEFFDNWKAKHGWNIPWQSVYDFRPEFKATEKPIAVKYGVTGIPFVALIGPDGKVIDVHVRGPRLMQQLEKLFPDVPPIEETEENQTIEDSAKPDATG